MTTWRDVYNQLGINFEDRKRRVYTGCWRTIPAKPAHSVTTTGVTPYEASRQSYIAKHGKHPTTDRIQFIRVDSDSDEWRKKAEHEIEHMRNLFTSSGYRDDLRRALQDMQHGLESLRFELAANSALNEKALTTIDQSKIRKFKGESNGKASIDRL